MFKQHLKAFETRLTAKTEAKTIDLWNSQTEADPNSIITPAVYVDFGEVLWTTLPSGEKQAQNTLITIHCASKHIRPTQSKAYDGDNNRLRRLDWSEEVLLALERFVGRDAQNRILFTALKLAGSVLDTNHDDLVHDTLTFQTTLYLRQTNRYAGGECIILEGVDDEVDNSIAIP